MKISDNGLSLIKGFEGYRNKAYDDGTGLITIGYGTIRYPNGKSVQENDTCNVLDAENWLINDVATTVAGINKLAFNTPLNQNQMDSLVSFTYNLGLGALKGSTLLKKVQIDPNDPTIKDEFLKWNKAGGKIVNGLTLRRQAEADNYFK